jgi:hypothetical protein
LAPRSAAWRARQRTITCARFFSPDGADVLAKRKELVRLVQSMCARVCHERRGGLVVEGWADGAVSHRRWRGRPVGWWASHGRGREDERSQLPDAMPGGQPTQGRDLAGNSTWSAPLGRSGCVAQVIARLGEETMRPLRWKQRFREESDPGAHRCLAGHPSDQTFYVVKPPARPSSRRRRGDGRPRSKVAASGSAWPPCGTCPPPAAEPCKPELPA